MAYITVEVDVDLDEFDDQQLIDEIESRGWIVGEEKDIEPFALTREEKQYLKQFVENDIIGIGRDIYEKLIL